MSFIMNIDISNLYRKLHTGEFVIVNFYLVVNYYQRRLDRVCQNTTGKLDMSKFIVITIIEKKL